jgi:hypothetical protein
MEVIARGAYYRELYVVKIHMALSLGLSALRE